MPLDDILESYPKSTAVRGGSKLSLRPLGRADYKAFHEFFCAVPETERLLFKHRVTDESVIRGWCEHLDYGRILPIVALDGDTIAADASLHQQLGGWKRHIGRISIFVHPKYRGRGLAEMMVRELIDIAKDLGLERLEAEFMGDQKAALHLFARLGFNELLVLKDYVKDMQALTHDYVLMGRSLVTDEEYAGAN